MIILNKNVRKTFVNDPLHPQYFDYFCSVAPIQTRVSNFSTMDDGAVKAQVLILFWALYHQYPAWKHAGGKKLWLRRFPICRKVCFETKRPTLYRESWARCTGVRWVYQTVMSGAENRERVCCMRVFNLNVRQGKCQRLFVEVHKYCDISSVWPSSDVHRAFWLHEQVGEEC